MKKAIVVATLGLALSACGGDGDGGPTFRDPDQATFTYGAGVTPSSAQAQAATQAATGAVSSTALADQAGTSAAPDQALAQASDPISGAGAVLPGGLPFGSSRALQGARADVLARATAFLLGDVAAATATWTPGCWRATTTRIQLRGCALDLAPELDGTVTLDGEFVLSAGLVYWDVTATLRATTDAGATTLRASERLLGNLAFTATTLTGFARADVALSTSGARTERLLVTLDTAYDLTYAPAATCASAVTGGTMTLKRLWAAVPSSAGDDPTFTDASARFTWTGCGHLTIAASW